MIDSALKVIRGILKLRGATDNTLIGNNGDRLKVDSSFDGTKLDAFGRLRVSNPETLFEAQFLIDKQPLLFTESTTGGASATFNADKSSVDLATSTSSGSKVVFQSKRYMAYHPGKSQLVILTGCLQGAQTNVRKRIGLFDDSNGVFFQLSGSTASNVIRSKVSGSVVDTVINQADWNIDKLDGTGASGINIDWTKQQILFVDFQWLGSGSVRFGTIIAGNIIYAHRFDCANNLTTPWSQFALWPIRTELENLAAVASPGLGTLTCGTVISEGGYGPDGLLRTVNNGTTVKSASGAASSTPLISIRKQSAYVNYPIKIEDFGAFVSSADDYLIKVTLNGTLTGASWSNTGSISQVDVSATAISGGTDLYSFYIRGGSGATSTQLADALRGAANVYLAADLAGTSDIISVVGVNITASASAAAFINFREFV